MTNEPQKPIRKFNDGKIKVAIWRNQSEKGTFYSTDLTRSYQDKDGNWHDTTGGFSGTDTLKAHRLLGLAYDAECELRAEDRAASQTD